MAEQREVDSVSGTATTGHQWDGIKELNTPLPRWWVWLFYATIIWAFGYWVVYPAWPLVTSYTTGMLGYSSRADVAVEVAALHTLRSEKAAALQKTSLVDIEKDPNLLAFARAQGKAAFGDNCAPCHGTGAAGGKGFPNLNDDDWLWGGKVTDIEQTIKFGIRAPNDQSRQSQMPAFLRDKTLKPEQIVTVANYVRSLSGLPVRPGVDLAAGKKLFADNCALCHGPEAKGNQELGAPNLTDKIWLYGSDEKDIIQTISYARNSVMPAWSGRLDPLTIKSLAVFVHTLGGGK
jgi:cytochrome c oxidase cbb3-type subunit III